MPLLRSTLAVLLLASVAAADELRTLDNKTISGTVVAVDDKEVAIKTLDGAIVKTPLDNVIALDLRAVKGVPYGVSYTEIRLIDDTTLNCKSFAIKGKTVVAKLLSDQDVTIPLPSVATILRGAEDSKLRKAWDALLADKIKRDRVVLYKGGAVNALDGTLGDADAEGTKIKFNTGGNNLEPLIANLQGMIFYRPEPPAGNAVCIIYDTAGNALAATKVVLTDDNKLTIETTIPKVSVTLAKDTVAKFDYNMGKLTWLSDLDPTKVVEKSGVGLIVTHRKDVNLDGEPILLDKQYPKGLSLHAHTELEYDLKGKFKKFSAVLGVDPRIGSDSQAKVTIEVDGRVQFSEVITVKKLETVNLNVTGATTIRIIVASRNFLDLHDHVTIANPKVTK